MQTLKLHYVLFSHLYSNYPRSFFPGFFSTVSVSLPTQFSKERTFVLDYLNSNFKFSKSQSIYVSKHVSMVRNPQNPLSVLNFFKKIGFSESQIQSMVLQKPQLMFSDVDRTLRPKMEFFQHVGFEGSELCDFISKNSTILTYSLKRTLIPSVEAIRKIVCNKRDFVQILKRCGRVLPKYQRLVSNVAFLESCGIVGSQLSMLLKRQSRLFIAQEASLRNYVSRAVEMGFNENSRMLVHALHTISSLSHKTFTRKLEFIQSFGFSKVESMEMFKSSPVLLRTSEKKLKVGIEFFLHTAMVPRSVLVHKPNVLMYSIEDRVVPRYRVLQILIAANLVKKVPSFTNVLCLSEEVFLDKYISRFRENAEALLIAYKGHYLEV